jgi:hypothetical protein
MLDVHLDDIAEIERRHLPMALHPQRTNRHRRVQALQRSQHRTNSRHDRLLPREAFLGATEGPEP